MGPALGRGSGVCPEVGGRAEGRRGSQLPGEGGQESKAPTSWAGNGAWAGVLTTALLH